MRWDALGCTGHWVNTPHLDRIAAETVRELAARALERIMSTTVRVG